MPIKTIGDAVLEDVKEYKYNSLKIGTNWGIEKLGLEERAKADYLHSGDINSAGNTYIVALKIIAELQEEIEELKAKILAFEDQTGD